MAFSNFLFFFLTLCLAMPTPISFSLSLSSEDLSKIPVKFLDFAKKPEIFDWMVSIRRKLHENPELGFEEFETGKLIRAELDEMGIPYKYPLAVTGIVGYIGSGEPPFVAIRADMDALAMEEAVEWEHKSKVPGKMHAWTRMRGGRSFICIQDVGHHLKLCIWGIYFPYTQSVVLVLLLRLAHELYPDRSEEALFTLDLLSRMVSSNMALCFVMMDIGNSFYVKETGSNRQMQRNVWVVDIICNLIKHLSLNSSSSAVMSMGVNILARMFKCMMLMLLCFLVLQRCFKSIATN